MDKIADMLTIIRNALAVNHYMVRIPFSKLKYEIAKILEREGFVEKVSKSGKKARKKIVIILKYDEGSPAISGLKRISKPGQRIYLPSKGIKKVKGGYGIAIISTSKGLMTDKEARRQNLGGEVICEVW
ncbi:30S ribosomal protein S8 [bacterium]|nr:30S ribosomal protein S8 [bacterium]